MVTIALTIDEVWTTLRPEYGRPVPVAEILDIAGRNASEMVGLRQSTYNIGIAIVGLQRIVDATKDAKLPSDTDDADDSDIPF